MTELCTDTVDIRLKQRPSAVNPLPSQDHRAVNGRGEIGGVYIFSLLAGA
jgi:hypothetical protein